MAFFTAKNIKLLLIDWTAYCILGEASNVRGPYDYPDSFQQVVVAIQARDITAQSAVSLLSPAVQIDLPGSSPSAFVYTTAGPSFDLAFLFCQNPSIFYRLFRLLL